MKNEPENNVTNPVTFFIPLKEITSIFAKWAVDLSPYIVPNNLEKAVLKFHSRLEISFSDRLVLDDKWIENASEEEIEKKIKEIILDKTFIEVQEWNNRKNGVQNPYNFVTAYSKIDPDDDFVDLHALARQIINEVIKEGTCKEEEFR